MRSVELREDSAPQNLDCPVLVTRRLVLRLPHEQDIEPLARWADMPQIAAQFSAMPSPFRRRDAEDFVTRARNGRIGSYVYAITLAENGEFIGCCGIGSYKSGAWPRAELPAAERQAALPHFPHSPYAPSAHLAAESGAASGNPADAELFFWLGRAYWQQGYGAEIANALADAAFRATELPALYARAQEQNSAANAILRKCGFALLHKSGHMGAGAAAALAINSYRLSRETWLELRRSTARQNS